MKKIGFVALLVVILLILRETVSVLMMILAATIIALYFHGLAGMIGRKIGISDKWSMALSFIVTFLILGGILWLVGAKIQEQVTQLSQKLPELIEQGKSKLQELPWGEKVTSQFSGKNAEKYMSTAKKLFGSTFGAVGDIYIILFLSIFIIAEPGVYRNGIVALIPARNKEKARDVLEK